MLALHRFSEDVRKVSSETGNFLLKPRASVSHQLFIAPVPQFVAMRESTWNAVACGFDNMLIDGFGLQWRQFAVPVNNFAIAADCSHDFILVPVHQHQIKDRELRQIQRRLTSQPTVTYVTTAGPASCSMATATRGVVGVTWTFAGFQFRPYNVQCKTVRLNAAVMVLE